MFSALLKLKGSEEFVWEERHQEAFEAIKRNLARPPVLMPPRKGKALRLYISAAEEAIGAFLVQENEHGNEQAGY